MGAAFIPILSSVAGAAASTLLGKVMSKGDSGPAPVEAPKVEPVSKVMPTADSDTVMAARKKSMLVQAQRQGRASTILSEQEPSDRLGG
jgi:hypothetical protein